MTDPDSADFDAFYAASARRVLLAVYALCGDLGDAEDILQEAYARAWQHWGKVADYDNPEAWVYSVARRLATNRWRRLRRWRGVQPRVAGSVMPTAGPSPDRVAVLTALQDLPLPQRQTVVQHYLLDMSVNEIAAMTHTPAGTVKARLSRARTALAGLLSEHDLEDNDVASHP